MDLTERHDLRSHALPWGAPTDTTLRKPDPLPERMVDVAICGAGVTGTMLAERLTARGMSVALVDRRPPAAGSTAASTALVLWEADIPLSHLAARIGEEAAVCRWARVRRAVLSLADRVADIPRIDLAARTSLYLDGDLLDEDGLRAEVALRARHGFPSTFLESSTVRERYGLSARPAILSTDSFAADPVRLTLAMLDLARTRGARVSWPVDLLRIETRADAVELTTDRGTFHARHAILASGYERPRLFLPPAFTLRASYAVATLPGTAPLWPGDGMIWEASTSYLYLRSDGEGRVIAGGGDEDFHDAVHRDRLIPEKAATIARNVEKLTGRSFEPHEKWAAIFGNSPDGLPAIGRAAHSDRLWLASGFGGNGISFAALAAELLTASLCDEDDPEGACFDPYRFPA
jgi:glycine/D-amino acid oxidase-like deaminating enzyme